MLSVAGIAVALGVLAMGAYSPHFRFFYDNVPGFNMFRSNSKFGVLVVVFLIFLSAHGLDMLLREERKKLAGGMFVAAVAACLAVVAMFVVVESCSATQFKGFMDPSLNSRETFLSHPQKLFGSHDAITAAAKFTGRELEMAMGFLAGLAVALGLIWRCPQWRRHLAPLVIGLIGVELLLFARDMHVSFPPELARAPLTNASIRQRSVDGQVSITSRKYPAPRKWRIGSSILATDARSAPMARMSPCSRMASPIFGATDPMALSAATPNSSPTPRETIPMKLTGINASSRYTAASTCSAANIAWTCRLMGRWLSNRPRNFAPLPKFLLVDNWQVEASRDDALKAICDQTFNPRENVVLERTPLAWSPPEKAKVASSDPAGTIHVLRESNRLARSREVTLAKPAILLQTDLYTPNWHVYALPGSSQSEYELIPANYILRAVPLQAGTHRLRIEYRPVGFVIGKWISLASLAAFLALLIFASYRTSR